jgi:predicted nucleotidyltransferase
MNKEIKQFCKKWKIRELSLFGSALTDKFNKESDIDILMAFNDNSHYGLFELAEMKSELEKIYGKEVDLVTRNSVEKSHNYIRRKSILSNLKSIYAE